MTLLTLDVNSFLRFVPNVVGVFAVPFIVYFSYRFNKNRLNALQKYAESKPGFTYSPIADENWANVTESPPFKVFNELFVIDSDLMESISFEANGKPGILFDYKYVTGTENNGYSRNSINNRNTHRFKVAFIYTGVNGSKITLSPNNIIKKVVLSSKEIKFEDQEFNSKFEVKCDDQKFAYDSITPEMIKAIKDFNLNSLVWDNNYLMYSASGSWSPDEVERVYNGLSEIIKYVPKFLIAESAPLPDDVILPGASVKLIPEYDAHHEQVTEYDKRQAEVAKAEALAAAQKTETQDPDSYEAKAKKKQEELREYEDSGKDDVKLTQYDIKQREVARKEAEAAARQLGEPVATVLEPLKPILDPLKPLLDPLAPLTKSLPHNPLAPHNPLHHNPDAV